MKVIILAGGKTNLPGKLKNIPKSLIEIKGRPLLEYQLDLLKKYKLNDIRLSLFYKAKDILKYLKKKDPKAKIRGKKGKIAGLEYVIGPKPLGTGGAIRSAAYGLKNEFLVMNGDVLTNINLADYLKFYKNNISEPRFFSFLPFKKRVPYETTLGAMAVFYTQDVGEMGLVKVKNDRMVKFTEKPDYPTSGYLNAGFYILSPQVFQTKEFKSKKHSQVFPIEKEIFPKLAEDDQLLVYVHRGLWTDIGSKEGLEKAEGIAEKLIEKE
ncbi:MAG: nucleotidyltransferase family protein [Patescibacteria group bacterium]